MPPLLFDVGQPLSRGFPGGPGGKESACDEGDPGLMPGLGRSPGEGNGNALWYSCLENFMDRGGWWATVHGFTNSQTCLSDWHFHFHSSQPLSTPSTPSSQLQAWACDPSLFNLVQATDSGKHKSHSVHCDPLLLENLLVMSFPGTCWPLCGAWFQCRYGGVWWAPVN